MCVCGCVCLHVFACMFIFLHVFCLYAYIFLFLLFFKFGVFSLSAIFRFLSFPLLLSTTSPCGQCTMRLGSVHFSHSVVYDSLLPHEPQHTRPPCPSLTPRVHSNPCPLSQWCHPTISFSVIPFSSFPQSFPASGSFQMNQLFASDGQSIVVSASTSVLPMNSQDWSPLGWTGWISLQSKGLSRVFSNTTVQKHQFFGVQPSSQSNSHIHTWPQEKP